MSAKGDSTEKLKGVQISSLDEEDDEVEEVVEEEEEEEEGDDSEEEEEEPVTLGFLEKTKNSWSLSRQVFPSKAGGVPAWLDPVNLPSGRSCVCDICEEPLQFLLQVYAPITEKESTFHRTLFVFMCPSMSCLHRDQHEQWKRSPEKPSRSVKVFRCQLPCSNPFYSSEPPRNDGTDKPSGSGVALHDFVFTSSSSNTELNLKFSVNGFGIQWGCDLSYLLARWNICNAMKLKDGPFEISLCNWCGTWKGDKVCSGCKRTKYCSHKHQVLHWHSGHKIDCQQLSLSVDSRSSKNGATSAEIIKGYNALWPEYEMINDDESEYDAEMSDDNIPTHSLVSRNKMDSTMNSLLDIFEGNSDKKCWVSFQHRIAKAPEQVLRYCRNASAKPLWPMSSGQPSKADIPNCSYCGGPSDFEFQILPQLLYYFGVKNDADSLDWATIVLYTCKSSCEGSMAYKEEFPWVQLYPTSAT
ncbi:hypothetical protein POTOM_010794 [Populus tomentosa]|uniref:MYND-type domain-containing protein n=1 Tax=Populus tomentosa TaxID=118781 RepID=A0A8X8AAP5_POPTO|nr:hypothetical protein POTOM_010794 [Populus tomentosa]